MSKRDEAAQKDMDDYVAKEIASFPRLNPDGHRNQGYTRRFGFKAGWDAATEAHRGLVEALEFYAHEVQRDDGDAFYAEYPLGRRAREALAAYRGGGRE